MARIIDPKTNLSGEVLRWEPDSIPSSKPFVNIITSPSGQLITQDDVHFIKTKSLIYSVFHSSAKYVNFEIGYSVQAKWFEYLKDRWSEYSSFYIGGFVEGIYCVNEKGNKTIYIQVDAKSIDYDPRFRTSTNSSGSPSVSLSPKSQNAFALRRSKVSHRISSEPAEKVDSESSENTNLILIDDYTSSNSMKTPTRTPKKRQLSDLCDELDNDKSDIDESNDNESNESIRPNKHQERGRGLGRGRGRGRGKK